MISVPWGDWFGWPTGQVWPNVTASVVVGVPTVVLALWHHRRRLVRRLRAEMAEHHVTIGDRVAAELEQWLGGRDDEGGEVS